MYCEIIEDAPSLIFPLFTALVIAEARNIVGNANCIVVNRKEGIVAVNAHVVNAGKKFKVYLPDATDRLIPTYAEIIRGCINWEADLALLRMHPPQNAVEFSDPVFAEVSQEEFPPVTIAAVMPDEKAVTARRMLKAAVLLQKSNSAITYSAAYELGCALDRWFPLRKKDRSILYKEYIYFTSTEGEARIEAGMSGGALLDKQGKLIGILSKGAGSSGLAIPSREITKLLSCVGS